MQAEDTADKRVRSLAAELSALLRPGLVSFANADRLAASGDLWPRQMLRMHLRRPCTLPAAVVWPETVEDVQAVCVFAQRAGVQVVPYGAGSGVVGGAAARAEQIVVDVKRLRAVLAIDGPGRRVTAQAGVLGELLHRQLKRAGFTQGHFPSSIYCSTVGGWLAARSAGQMSSRYGKIEDQVLGGLVVLPDGTAVRQAAAPVLLPPLSTLVGSEGTLGFWLEASLRIHPLPAARAWRAFDFPSLEAALSAARQWLQAGIAPSVLRVYDPLDSWLHRGTHKARAPHDRGPSLSALLGAHLPRLVSSVGDRLGGGRCRCILGLEGSHAAVALEMQQVLDVAASLAAEDCGEGPAVDWYNKRYAVSYRMSNVFRAGVAADTMEVACPWERLVPAYHAVRAAALSAGAQVLAHFSHVYLEGGSIYFTFAFPASQGEAAYDCLWEKVLEAALGAGANVSHHHGVGQLKRAALQRSMGDAGATLEALRSSFDPKRRFNPQSLSMDMDPAAAAAAPPPYVPVEPPAARSHVVAVKPQHTLAEVEAHLLRVGKSLGPVAALLGHMPVAEAARGHWLWRVNPQLHTVESAVQGISAAVQGTAAHYAAAVAPRSAQGPDLTAAALAQHSPQRIWLRCAAVPAHVLQFATPLNKALECAQRLAQHEHGRLVRPMIQHQGGRLRLWVAIPPGPHEALAQRLVAQVVEQKPTAQGPVVWQAWAEQPMQWLGGRWDSLAAQLQLTCDWVLPWIDPVGAVGLAAPDLALAPLTTGTPAAPTQLTPQPIPNPGDAPAWDGRLRLSGDAVPLSNCTYCPKLCRFACPVAVAHSGETLTPRQLMLTANLDRTGRRPLSQDAAQRLYSCVDCRGCRSFCEHDNDVATVLQHARRELWAGRAAPDKVHALVQSYRHTGQLPNAPPPGAPPEGAAAAAHAHLWLGCQAADPAAAAGALWASQLQFGAVHVRAGGCCGHPLYRWGAEDDFRAHAQRMMQQIPAHVRTLVLDDPGCVHAVRDLYPRVGVAVPRVRWVGELLDAQSWDRVDGAWALHDGCFARNTLQQPGLGARLPKACAPRPGSVLNDQAGCCGGMLLPLYDAALAQRVAQDRTADLLGGGATRILSSSPTCSRRLRAVGAPVDDWLAVWLAAQDVRQANGRR